MPQELLGAMIRVENDRDTIVLGHGTEVHNKGHSHGMFHVPHGMFMCLMLEIDTTSSGK